jgi:hypothetical protein
MDTAMVIGLAIAVPVILAPAAFVWYMNLGGIHAAVKEARERRAVEMKDAAAVQAK